MAWTLNQSPVTGSRGIGNTLTGTFGSSVAEGDLIVLLAANSYGINGSTVSDNKGNTYVQAAVSVNTSILVEIWFATAFNSGSGLQVTYSPAGASRQALILLDTSDIGNYVVDNFSEGTGSGSNLTSGPFSTTNTDLLVGIGGSAVGSQTWTVEGGLTEDFSTSGLPTVAMAGGHSLNVAAGSQAISIQTGTTGIWACCGVAFSSLPPIVATALPWNYQKPIRRPLSVADINARYD